MEILKFFDKYWDLLVDATNPQCALIKAETLWVGTPYNNSYDDFLNEYYKSFDKEINVEEQLKHAVDVTLLGKSMCIDWGINMDIPRQNLDLIELPNYTQIYPED
jgi:hypothetical protein